MDLSQRVMDEVLPGVDLREIITTSTTAILCNSFAAKPRFWREWLLRCERIFDMAESKGHPRAIELNRGYFQRGRPMPAKVFIIERMASLLLATSTGFKVEKFSISSMSNTFGKMPWALFYSLDMLKSQALMGHPALMNAFSHIQQEIISCDEAQNERNLWLKLNPDHAPSRGYEHWGQGFTAGKKKRETFGLSWLLRRLMR